MSVGILERSSELQRIAIAARRARAGRGCVLLVSGEAGIGKSSLVAASRAELPPEGRLLVGRCDDLATPRPLGPLRDLSPAVGPTLRQALTTGADREVLLQAVRSELSAPGQCTVLAVEDVHWADDATLDVLRYLARRIEALPLVLMLTYRDDELPGGHPLRQLLGIVAAGRENDRLPLLPLSAAAVADLCAAVGMDPVEVYAVTGGNPYYVTEVLAARSSVEVPRSVVDAVLAKVRHLDPAARAAVEQLSVLAAAADRALVDALVPQGIASIAAVEEWGLVTVRSGRVAFRHELTRRAVLDALSPSRRALLEGRVVTVLCTLPDPDPARIVHHAALAGDATAIIRYAPLAARQAARSGAHREAAAHYRLALEHADAYSDLERAALFEGSAIECYTVASDRRSAAADQAAAVQLRRRLHDQVALGASLRWLSRICWWTGDRPGAEAAAVEAVAVLRRAGDRRLLAMAYSNQSQLHMLADRSDEALAMGSRAVELARAEGDATTLSHALCNVGTARWHRGDDNALAALTESLHVALEAQEYEHACRAYVNTIWCYLDDLRPAAAEPMLAEALALAADSEQLVFRDYMLVERGMIDLAAGRFAEAAASARPGLENPGPIRSAALVVINRAAVRTGMADRELLDQMWQVATGLGELQRTAPAAAVLAEAAWLAGGDDALRESDVRERIGVVYEEALRKRRQPIVAELGYWMWRAGAADLRIGASEHPFVRLATGRWSESARAWEAAGYPYERAVALSESPHADDVLAALAIADRLGARPLATRIRRDLHGRGTVRVPRGPARATRTNPAGLTARQAEVLELVRQGLTNAQIACRLVISERTADHHVSAILAKLGVSRRADAVEVVPAATASLHADPELGTVRG